MGKLINRIDRWPGLDLRHLAALEAVARVSSFAKAAAELGYTQPAVSQQIAGLERVVGTRLFERGSGPKPVKLTAAGALLLRHVEAIQARLAAAQADLESLVAGESGTLRIGTFQSVASRVLPPLVQRFSAEWPEVEIRLTERDDDMDLLEFIERGELDLAFVMLPVPEGPFEAVEVVSDDYLLISHPDAALEGVADLEGVPLIGFRQCRSHSLLEDAMRRLGIEPNVVFRSDDDVQLPARQRQLIQVVRPRDEPGREAAQPQAEHVRDALVAAEGRDLAEHPVPVGLRLAGQVLREAARLAERVLLRGRIRRVRGREVGDARAVAERPDPLRDLQVFVDLDAAALVERQAERADERVRTHACRPDERLCVELRAVRKERAAGVDPLERRPNVDLDPTARELLRGVVS